MPVQNTDGSRRLSLLIAAAITLAATTAPAMANVWRAERDGSRASLPIKSETVSDAAMVCAGQRWTLELKMKRALTGDAAKLGILVDGNPYPTSARLAGETVSIAIERSMLEPIMAGQKLTIDFPETLETSVGDLDVPLRGSRRAISAVQEACAQIDMSAYEAVPLTSAKKSVDLVTEIRAEDIKAFNYATTAKPKIEAASVDVSDDHSIVFGRLCGSWWYYGASGCNITGYVQLPAQVDPEAEDGAEATATRWQPVFDSENATLYIDPANVHDGWPDIITLPTRPHNWPKVWRWDGERYSLHATFGEDEVEDEPAAEEAKASEEPAEMFGPPIPEEAAVAPEPEQAAKEALSPEEPAAEPAPEPTEQKAEPEVEAPAAEPEAPKPEGQ